MTLVIDVRNAAWSESGNIRCNVRFVGKNGYLPYSASRLDMEAHGVELYQGLTAGRWGEIAPFTETPELRETARDQKRAEIKTWGITQERITDTLTFEGQQWEYSCSAQLHLLPVVALANKDALPDDYYLTDADGNDVMLTATQLSELYEATLQAIVAKEFGIRKQQRVMLNELDSLNTLEEIRNYPVPGTTQSGATV